MSAILNLMKILQLMFLFCSIKEACQSIRVELFKDNYREKIPSNKTPVLTKLMNNDTLVVGTSNQFFLKSSETDTKFSKR